MGTPQPLATDLVQRYRKLGDHGRVVLDGISKHFPDSTIEWVSQADADRRKKNSERFNGFCDAITADVTAMKANIDLLHQHRSAATLARLEVHRQRDRRRFLQPLLPRGAGYIDLRAIKRDAADEKDRVRTRMVPAGDLEAVESFIKRYEREGRDIYVGIASRLDPSKGGKLRNCGAVRALFVDIDFKDTPEPEARERLEAFGRQTDMTICSGNGFHVYWLLGTPCDLQKDASVFERHLQAIAKAIGGDTRCAEPAHILRLPGTMNFKYSPAREVRLVQA